MTDGEAWTREQLEALLAARFTPAALGRFLVASQRRAGSVRGARPELAGQERAWIVAGFAAWAALALAGLQPFRRRLSHAFAWWALTGLMLDWHLGMIETRDGRPRPLGAADALTLGRAWLVPAAADAPTPLVCGLAAASDVLDGQLARRAEPTRAGRDLEGLVDACFAGAALRGAVRRGWIGRSAARIEVARLGVGFGYGLYVYFGRASAPSTGVIRAARVSTPIRAGALIAAGLGRRRTADAALITGSAWSVAAVVRAVREEAPLAGAR